MGQINPVRKKINRVLLVEDNPDDIAVIGKSFNESMVVDQFFVAKDGRQAWNYLQHRVGYQSSGQSPRPAWILLDIAIPEIGGLDLLKIIKKDAIFRTIPTVVLTGSGRREDIIEGYSFGCNSFIRKPAESGRFADVVRNIALYWGGINIESPEY